MKALTFIAILVFSVGLTSGQFTCDSMGLFPDRSSPDCSTYYACIITEGALVPVQATCPSNTVFHWIYSGCVELDSFVCPNTPEPTTMPPETTMAPTTAPPETTQPPTETTTNTQPPPPTATTTQPPVTTVPPTTQSPTTQAPTTQPPITQPSSTQPPATTTATTTTTTTTPPRFVCPARGSFGDEDSLDCRTYHSCSNIGQLPTVGTCNGNTAFDWTRRQCVSANHFICAMASEPFACPSSGDWPNPNSADCSTFFQCFMNWDARVLHQTGICPGNTAFDWDRRQCISSNQASCRA